MVPDADESGQSESTSAQSLTEQSVSSLGTESVGGRGDLTSAIRLELGSTERGLLPSGNGSHAMMNSSAEPWTTEEDGILDLTSAQLHNLKEIELPDSLTELDLTANRLTEVDERIGQMALLTKLSLRQNLFEDAAVEPLMRWPSLFGLHELVLRDNRLTKIPSIGAFKNLTVLDMSFNKITSMDGNSQVTAKLRELYLSNNAVVEIKEVDHLRELQILELGANKIREMGGIQKLTLLKELWLGRNRIRLVDICGLTSLIKISLQSNRLTSMLGFQECVLLQELYLSHNYITEMEGLSTLQQLRILDVSSNKLEAIKNVGNLTQLEDLWLNDNTIQSLDDVDTVLGGMRDSLTTIYLERNPCSRSSDYVTRLKAMVPKLVQIDSQFFG